MMMVSEIDCKDCLASNLHGQEVKGHWCLKSLYFMNQTIELKFWRRFIIGVVQKQNHATLDIPTHDQVNEF